MKEINIFFPDPDLLKPYLYLKDIELQCYELSSAPTMMNNRDVFNDINQGIFQFIEYGVFVSPELIIDLCDYIRMTKSRRDTIIQRYNDRKKYEQSLRREQTLPNFSY